MSARPSSKPSAIVAAERWGEQNAAFVTAVFQRWDEDGEWPGVDDIGRQAIRERWGFDAFTLAEGLPRPLGVSQNGGDQRITLRVRGLSFAPPAWSLLGDFMRAIRLAAKLYVEESGTPKLLGVHLTDILGLDERRATQVIRLLDIDYWMLGSRSGDPGRDWYRELRRSCRHLIGVESLADYLQVESEQVLWAAPAAPVTLIERPVEDDLVPGALPFESAVTAPKAVAELAGSKIGSRSGDIPSVFISYAHEDKALAREFADGLVSHALQVWVDDNELLAGDSIIEQISNAVAGVDFFCALVSEASHQSRWCQRELALAMTRDLGRDDATVIPLRVGDVEMPASITDRLYVDLDPTNVTAAIERIASDVRRHRERQRQLHGVGRDPR
jgi:hypothetical protein